MNLRTQFGECFYIIIQTTHALDKQALLYRENDI